MQHAHFPPHPALLDFINGVSVVEIDFAQGGVSAIYPFVPSHNRFLCFCLQDPMKMKKPGGDFGVWGRSVIIGPQLTPLTLDLGQQQQMVVVCLKPAGMYRLLGIPMHELVDHDYDARLLMGCEIDELLEQLQEARGDEVRNAIIQRYLLGKLPQLRAALPFDQALLALVHASGNQPIEQVAARACLSLRQFERHSHERLGLPPKLYGRMIRFSHAYKCKESTPHASWSEISYRCGYFDQMHLIRDFKFFTGRTPGTLTEAAVKHSVRFRTMEDLSVSLA